MFFLITLTDATKYLNLQSPPNIAVYSSCKMKNNH